MTRPDVTLHSFSQSLSALKPRGLLLLPIAFLAFALCASAQITNVTNSTSTPIPGAGHDYIKMLSETVNPANGSVSIRIQTPTPPGRGVSLPFSFAYDSNGVAHVTSNSIGIPSWTDNTAYLSTGGWSYSVPMLSNVLMEVPILPHGLCGYFMDYVFQDPTAGRHSLRVSYVLDPGPTQCGLATPPPSQVLTGGDDYYIASLGPTLATIADPGGTVYTFPSLSQQHAGTGNGSLPASSLPSSIEDRNGNQILITDLGLQQNGVAGSFTMTDTLGRTLLSSSGFGVSGNTLAVSGIPTPYSITWGTTGVNFPINSWLLFNGQNECYSFIPGQGGTHSVIKNIRLPNNQSYQFSYDPASGLVSKITYPTGGNVQYTWGVNSRSEAAQFEDTKGDGNSCIFEYDVPAVTKRIVSFDGTTPALTQVFTYSPTKWSSNLYWSAKTTTVTTTDNITGLVSTVVYTYSPVNAPNQPNDIRFFTPQIPVEQTVVHSAGTTLRTVNKTWYDQYEMQSVQTVLENGFTNQTTYIYGTFAQVIDKKEYDYGSTAPGALLRETATAYQAFIAGPTGAYIHDRPCQSVVYDGSRNSYAETDYFYDNGGTGTVCGTAGTPSVSSAGGASLTGHDETNYGVSSTTCAGRACPRGNVTQKTQSSTGASPVTTYTYDETGQVLSMIDPCGYAACSDMAGTTHTTKYSYADGYTVLSGGSNVGYTPSGKTNAYLTTITNALGQTENFTYDYNNGQLTASKDQNLQPTFYIYSDPLARPTQVNYPDGGQTQYAYNDAPSSPGVTTCQLMSGTAGATCSPVSPPSGWKTTLATMDGIGHAVKTTLVSDSDGPTYTTAVYDGLGRRYTVSNPYRSTSDPTYGITTYTYDAVGRTTKVTHPDGTLIGTSYTGRATDVLDEGNGTRNTETVSQVDGLGRVVSICEVTGTAQLGAGGTPTACGQDVAKTGFLTSYVYNVLGNLLSVNQGSLGQRTFAYDSLSRLLCAANPETGSATCPNPDNGTYTAGTTRYGYDANGNLSSLTRPAPNQTNGAVTVAAMYQYDALNRTTQKSYSDGVTPTAMFGYDQANVTMGAQKFNITNSIGRLSWECTIAPTNCPTMTAFSYDKIGRTAQLWQCQHLNCTLPNIVFSYDYDLIGDELDYFIGTVPPGSTEAVSTYSSAGRLTSFTSPTFDSNNPANLLTGVHYDPFGHIISANLANGLSLSSGYDARGRVTAMAVGTNCSVGNCSTNKYRFTTGYAPNSDIVSSTDTVNGNWTYTYDDLNRLSTGVANNGEGCSWDYDRYGNRWHQNAHSGSCTGIL